MRLHNSWKLAHDHRSWSTFCYESSHHSIKEKKKVDFVCLLCYLEHVCVVVMAVLHHHGLVSGQCERDAVLPPAVHRLQQQQQQQLVVQQSFSGSFFLFI